MQQGLTEDKISAVGDYTQSSYFSSREKLALTYADRITLSDQDVDDDAKISLWFAPNLKCID